MLVEQNKERYTYNIYIGARQLAQYFANAGRFQLEALGSDVE